MPAAAVNQWSQFGEFKFQGCGTTGGYFKIHPLTLHKDGMKEALIKMYNRVLGEELGVDMTLKYSAIFECFHRHDDVHCGGDASLPQWISPFSNTMTVQQLLDDIRADKVNAFLTLQGGRDGADPNDPMDPASQLGFLIQADEPDPLELGSHTKESIRRRGKSASKFCSGKKLTSSRYDFTKNAVTISSHYWKMLDKERGLTGYRITHAVVYKPSMVYAEVIDPMLQRRHDLKKQPNLKPSDMLLSLTLKLFGNSFFGMSLIRMNRFSKCRVVTLSWLMRHRDFKIKRSMNGWTERHGIKVQYSMPYHETLKPLALIPIGTYKKKGRKTCNFEKASGGVSFRDIDNEALRNLLYESRHNKDAFFDDSAESCSSSTAEDSSSSVEEEEEEEEEGPVTGADFILDQAQVQGGNSSDEEEENNEPERRKKRTYYEHGDTAKRLERMPFQMLFLMPHKSNSSPISKSIQIGCSILGASKKCFLSRCNTILSLCCPTKVNLCYTDTDSALISHKGDSLFECLRDPRDAPKLHAIMDEPGSQKHGGGKFHNDGVFKFGYFPGIKFYLLSNQAHDDPSAQVCNIPEVLFRVKGIPLKAQRELPLSAFIPEENQPTAHYVHYRKLKSSQHHSVGISHESRVLSEPINLKRTSVVSFTFNFMS